MPAAPLARPVDTPPSVPHQLASVVAADITAFAEGTHARLYRFMGAHLDADGHATFRVWAPGAAQVSVIGEFNGWDAAAAPLAARWDSSGIWEGSIDGLAQGMRYKYRIVAAQSGQVLEKADPFAFAAEAPPHTASRLWSLDYRWHDDDWMRERGAVNAHNKPMSIYEVHLGSWQHPGNDEVPYRSLAHAIADYACDMGFTHVELMPVTEHPFYGSWGYQTTGYFAPTARYGTPQDFMYMVDHLHQRGLGVILDWVPAHFPNDAHGLATFDGTHLFEHADPRKGFHPEWRSHIFNYGRHEVRAFLTSSALFWLDHYHIDGLRVDGVASMLYLDYARKAGEWVPNVHGGNQNLEAVTFLQQLNVAAYREYPDIQTIAEESTAWPGVSRPVHSGGLGFGFKWNMGWMHDTLAYFERDPLYRKYHQGELTFSIAYAFDEHFVLPLSHDEVVYGKHALVGKMPGDDWQKFANLRALFGYMWAHPGKKLVFMGDEFGERGEWQHGSFLDWAALQRPEHHGVRDWLRDLNRYYRATPALYEQDSVSAGFEWIDASDTQQSIVSFLRKAATGTPPVLVVCNLTPAPRYQYSVGVPAAGRWRETLNSDATVYGGSGMGNLGGVATSAVPAHGQPWSLALTLPPLSVSYFERDG